MATVRKGKIMGKRVRRPARTHFPTDCLGTTEGRIHPAPCNAKSVRVRPFAKGASRTLCNVREAAYGKLTAGCKVIRGRKRIFTKGRWSIGTTNRTETLPDTVCPYPAYNSVYVIAYHVFIVDKQIIVAVAAIPVFFAESSRHISIFAWLTP